MGLLETLTGPDDVRALDPAQLPQLATEIRDRLVQAVSRTGGHLGPNLGAVELGIAIHRVFSSPQDKIIWDTGHQAYVHKMLTGRAADFDTLRQRGGLSGYPSRSESEHDMVENSHASTALSYADGLAKAYQLRGEKRSVVAVVGDGALTGGMCWEALNNIAASDRPVIIVVNDNGRSYAPTIGGLADHLGSLRLAPQYEEVLDVIRSVLTRTPLVGAPLYEALHGIKRGIKDIVQPQGLFEDLGLKYLGPVDGHDTAAVESALRRANDFGRPVIVHCVTRKGFGYQPAEDDEADCLHGVGVIDPVSGKPLAAAGAPSWTSVFGDELVKIAEQRPDLVAVTAAMLQPVGLTSFAQRWPDRVFDVGIAEQHAVTSAAGLAMGGMHPVVCLYATFLNRAFDQLLMDVALHGLPVTFVLDRAGVTGPDGASHNGMWDLSFLPIIPGIRVAAPRDGDQLRALLREATAIDDGPSVVRFPKGAAGETIPALERIGGSTGVDVLARGTSPDVLLVSVGAFAPLALQAAARAADQGIGVTVVDPRWVLPLNEALVELAGRHRLVVTLEDNGRVGGIGTVVSQLLRDHDVDAPLRNIGLPQDFLAHGERAEVLAESGLSARELTRTVVEAVSRLTDARDLTDLSDVHGQVDLREPVDVRDTGQLWPITDADAPRPGDDGSGSTD
jgi:1-deoxy-D-xylulose-5-phosphate synthase